MGQGAVLFIDWDYNWISNCITLYCGLKIYSHEEKNSISLCYKSSDVACDMLSENFI